MMRLRVGKWRASGWVPGGCSAISTPSAPMRSCRAAFSGGQAMSSPLAITPAVPVASEPSCAAVSMPRARPLTTSQPARPSSAANSRAIFRAAAEALRAPTIATAGRSSNSARPFTASTGGAPSASASSGG